MGWLRKLARITLYTLLSGVLLVVLAIGGFKLLVRQLPDYQDEIQVWVTAELGFELDYTQLDAAWGWRGPELAFRDVRVRAVGDTAPFLTARGASVGFKTIDLLFRLATRPQARRRPAHVRWHGAHAGPQRGRATDCRARRRRRASRLRCVCRKTSKCWYATAACCISTPRAALPGTSRTSPGACAATTKC